MRTTTIRTMAPPGSRNTAGVAMPRPIIRPPVWGSPLAEGNNVTDFLGLVGSLAFVPWMEDGLCRQAANPDAWFPTTGQHNATTRTAMRVCRSCPVVETCLNYALERPDLQGIWGGTTNRERKAFHRKASA